MNKNLNKPYKKNIFLVLENIVILQMTSITNYRNSFLLFTMRFLLNPKFYFNIFIYNNTLQLTKKL